MGGLLNIFAALKGYTSAMDQDRELQQQQEKENLRNLTQMLWKVSENEAYDTQSREDALRFALQAATGKGKSKEAESLLGRIMARRHQTEAGQTQSQSSSAPGLGLQMGATVPRLPLPDRSTNPLSPRPSGMDVGAVRPSPPPAIPGGVPRGGMPGGQPLPNMMGNGVGGGGVSSGGGQTPAPSLAPSVPPISYSGASGAPFRLRSQSEMFQEKLDQERQLGLVRQEMEDVALNRKEGMLRDRGVPSWQVNQSLYGITPPAPIALGYGAYAARGPSGDYQYSQVDTPYLGAMIDEKEARAENYRNPARKTVRIKGPDGQPQYAVQDRSGKIYDRTTGEELPGAVPWVSPTTQSEPLVKMTYFDEATGRDVVEYIPRSQVPGGQMDAPRTTEMRNKEFVLGKASQSVNAIKALSTRLITKRGIAQRATAMGRSVEGALGSDPEYIAYQDARMALAGNLAVLQQGSRPSDADIKAIWLPMVPDVFRDTDESAGIKWDLIETMSGLRQRGPTVPKPGPINGSPQTGPPQKPQKPAVPKVSKVPSANPIDALVSDYGGGQ